VAPQNRFYGGFGLGSAPDNVTEFGVFVEALARHLVGRYGHAEVSQWRFRLGTEADGPRMGPRWTGPTGNDPVAMPVGDGIIDYNDLVDNRPFVARVHQHRLRSATPHGLCHAAPRIPTPVLVWRWLFRGCSGWWVGFWVNRGQPMGVGTDQGGVEQQC